jgi:hypothetical protein
MLALLFIARYVFLWMLVILAPLAFFCYILPATRKIWSMWWNQFIGWCFVGIGAAFFLYLAQRMADIIGTFVLHPSGEETQLDELSVMLLYAVPFIFLAAGYIATVSFAPAGARQIIVLVTKGGRWAKGKAWERLKRETRKGLVEKTRGKIPEPVKKAITKLETAKPVWGAKETGWRGAIKRTVSAPVTWALRGTGKLGKVVTLGGEVADKKAAARARQEALKRTSPENLYALRIAASPAERAGIMSGMKEQEQLKQAVEEGAITLPELLPAYQEAQQVGYRDLAKTLERYTYHLDKVRKAFAAINKETEEEYATRVLKDTKSEEEFKQFNLKAIKENEALYKKFTEKGLYLEPNQLANAGRVLGREFIDEVQRLAEEKGIEWFFEIEPGTGRMRNPLLPRYFASTGALAIGYSPLPGGENIGAMRDMMVRGREWERKLSRANTKEELEKLKKEIKEAEEKEKDERIKAIISSARTAAETKLRQLEQEKKPEEVEEEKEEKEGEEKPYWKG